MLLRDIIQVLQLSIGPVILISGAGLVLLSITNRFARVIDRARLCAESIRKSGDEDDVRFRTQLRFLMHRARLLRASIALVSTSILMAALLVISMFLIGLLDIERADTVITLFILSMTALLAGLVIFIIDVNVSLEAVAIETSVDKP